MSDVPVRYRGLWRRSLLETADGRDTGTTVFWLQAARWHADIRIPAGRPDFTGIDSLAGCDGMQRAWLATQQGFSGITTVRKEAGGEICSWRRLVDYQPPQAMPDEGWMRFEPTRLVETGMHAAYLEHWHLVPHSSEDMAVLESADAVDTDGGRTEMLFLAGRYLMHLAWPQASAYAKTGAMLDFEISFGERSANGYVIVHSTMPWLEGKERALRIIAQEGDIVELACDGCVRKWKLLEEGPGNF
jgi:hypothetical protein